MLELSGCNDKSPTHRRCPAQLYEGGADLCRDEAAAGGVRYRGRMQVFESDGNFKAVGAEGPGAEFDGNQQIIEPFFLSFRPKIVDENVEPASAVPITDAPPAPPPAPVLPANQLF